MPFSTASKASDRGRHHRPAIGHRLPRRHAVTLASGGHDDDRRALVIRAELRRRDEADGLGNRARSGPSPTTTSGEPAGGVCELLHSLLLGEPTDVQHVRRLLGLAHVSRDADAARDHAHVSRAQTASVVRERRRRTDDDVRRGGRADARADGPAGERDVGPPQLEHQRLPGREGGQRRQAASARGRRRRRVRHARAARAKSTRKSGARDPPRRRPKVVDDPVAVGDAVVPEGLQARRPRPSTPFARSASTPSRRTPGDVAPRPRYDVVRTTTFSRRSSRSCASARAGDREQREHVEVVEGHRQVEDVGDHRRDYDAAVRPQPSGRIARRERVSRPPRARDRCAASAHARRNR